MSSPFLIGQSLSNGTRNNFTGTVGFQFTVGASNLNVTQLGRWVVSGNSLTHDITIYDVAAATVIGTVTVNTSGAPAAAYLYGNLSSAVTLVAGKSYGIESSEVNGGDLWFENAAVTNDAVMGTINFGLFNHTNPNAGGSNSFVPPNFQTGSAALVGDLSITLAADTLVAAGSVAVAGDLSKTLAAVTDSAAGSVPASGSLTKTLADDTLSAVGSHNVFGDLSATLDDDTLSADGTATVHGALTKTLDPDTLDAAGGVAVAGALSKTLGADTLSAAGSVDIAGSLTKTLAAVTILAAGVQLDQVLGDLDITLAGMVVAGAGTRKVPPPPNNLVSGRTRNDFWQTHDFPEVG